MQIEEVKTKPRSKGTARDYLELIKPRETGLLVFIGIITALIAGNGSLNPGRSVWVLAAILLASAGANGLTNYLDRNLDARMRRTCRRVLPAGKIYPPERALLFTAGLSVAGLVLAWYLHPYVFLAGLVGTFAAIIYRKKVTCVFPQGMVASWAPVLMGWFAVSTSITWTIGLLCILISAWLPSHIWSIMLAHQEEYRAAGITYFPVGSSRQTVTRILLVFSIILLAASLGLYFINIGFGPLYLVMSVALGLLVVYASLRLVISNASADAWKLYKFSAFPYLGLLFLTMALDIWLRL